MLWINENISSGNIMKTLFLPSVISLTIPVWLISYSLTGKLSFTSPTSDIPAGSFNKPLQNSILIIGILCLLAVPVFKSVTDLPPFAGIMFTLGLFWIYLDILYNRRSRQQPAMSQYRVPYVLSKVDFSTILFFLGILMSVAALEAIGILHTLSGFLNAKIHNVYLISIIIGLLSSIIDNVPLVAAAMGMYPLTTPLHTGIPEGIT